MYGMNPLSHAKEDFALRSSWVEWRLNFQPTSSSHILVFESIPFDIRVYDWLLWSHYLLCNSHPFSRRLCTSLSSPSHPLLTISISAIPFHHIQLSYTAFSLFPYQLQATSYLLIYLMLDWIGLFTLMLNWCLTVKWQILCNSCTIYYMKYLYCTMLYQLYYDKTI